MHSPFCSTENTRQQRAVCLFLLFCEGILCANLLMLRLGIPWMEKPVLLLDHDDWEVGIQSILVWVS